MSEFITILDGAMGTMLQNAGLELGARPEIFGMEHPEILEAIQRSYVEAGSDIIYANTFGANAHKLEGTGHTVQELVPANISAAKRAAAGRALVALDVGPIGELMEPLGTLSFDEAYQIYAEMVEAGEAAGADLVVFETMTDLYEVKAAVLAAREHSHLPIWVTMSFEANGRTFTGTTVPAMAATLDGLGVSAIGINCSLGPQEIFPLIQEMRAWTDLPLIVKPNAGLPDPSTGEYDMKADTFARQMRPFLENGVLILGGCCGTTPDFIAALSGLRREWIGRGLAQERNGFICPEEIRNNAEWESYTPNESCLEESPTGGECPGEAGTGALADGRVVSNTVPGREYPNEAGTGVFTGRKTRGLETTGADAHTSDTVPVRCPLRVKGLELSAAVTVPETASRPKRRRGVCSAGRMTDFGGVRVIGERINPTGKKRFQQALRERDLNYIMERAIEQADAGADILDINVGLPGIDEPQLMREVVQAVQSVVDLPLQIDSSDPAAIETGLRYCNGRAIVNSVNAEPEKLEEILPIVKKYGAAVVGLTMDKDGIPQTAEKRFELAEKILNAAQSIGIPKEDVLIDCLTLTISAQQEQAVETLKAVRMVHEQLGLHCVLGVSNISFGLPQRLHITTSFLTQAMYCGLDLPIINPNQTDIMDTVVSFRALSGEDAQCAAYIDRFAGAVTEKKPASSSKEMTVEDAVLKGLKKETADITAKLLETMSELDVINLKLIPALDVVGDKYEKQQIFLPQLINAANAACAGFDLIKDRIAARGGESVSKGKIVMATVEGDIHDIGKNIVRVVLENYGYQVIDLGRDVPVQKVVDAVIAEDVKLVGLSALMTTTVVSMKKTIEALRASGHECKVMVGGAVLTPEYAEEIGADYYTKDAKASVDVAKEVLG